MVNECQSSSHSRSSSSSSSSSMPGRFSEDVEWAMVLYSSPQGHWYRRTTVGRVCWTRKLGISFDRVGINGFRTDGDDRLLIYQAILFQPFIFFHAWRYNRSWTLIVDDRKFRSFTKNRAICILSDYLCLHRDHYNQPLTVHPSSISSAYHICQSNLIFGILF